MSWSPLWAQGHHRRPYKGKGQRGRVKERCEDGFEVGGGARSPGTWAPLEAGRGWEQILLRSFPRGRSPAHLLVLAQAGLLPPEPWEWIVLLSGVELCGDLYETNTEVPSQISLLTAALRPKSLLATSASPASPASLLPSWPHLVARLIWGLCSLNVPRSFVLCLPLSESHPFPSDLQEASPSLQGRWRPAPMPVVLVSPPWAHHTRHWGDSRVTIHVGLSLPTR